MKIGVDLDGVVADFCYSFSHKCNELYGSEMLTETDQIISWDFKEILKLNQSQIDKAFEEIDKSRTFWRALKVLDRKSFNYFKKYFNNQEVYWITNRSKGVNIFSQSVEWLDSFGWRNPQVIVTEKKWRIVKDLQLRYFLDDHLENCEQIYRHTNCIPVVYDYPHNRKNKVLKRVFNLREFTDIVK